MALLDGMAIALMTASAAGSVYAIVALCAVRRFAAASLEQKIATERPPVTILKPLHGAEPGLEENLRTFCNQAYPTVQVVFGIRQGDDPAVAIAQRLEAEVGRRGRGGTEVALVVDGRTHGANGKVGNLINMMAAAKHDVLVIADSDMAAAPDYLETIVAELRATSGGVVTCLYLGRPVDSPWARLGAQFVNHEFLPSVLVGRMLGADTGCFGATIALDRAARLCRLGGHASRAAGAPRLRTGRHHERVGPCLGGRLGCANLGIMGHRPDVRSRTAAVAGTAARRPVVLHTGRELLRRTGRLARPRVQDRCPRSPHAGRLTHERS